MGKGQSELIAFRLHPRDKYRPREAQALVKLERLKQRYETDNLRDFMAEVILAYPDDGMPALPDPETMTVSIDEDALARRVAREVSQEVARLMRQMRLSQEPVDAGGNMPIPEDVKASIVAAAGEEYIPPTEGLRTGAGQPNAASGNGHRNE